jgi:hypothetical protein
VNQVTFIVVQPVTKAQRLQCGGGARVQVAMFNAKVQPPPVQVEEFAAEARTAFS